MRHFSRSSRARRRTALLVAVSLAAIVLLLCLARRRLPTVRHLHAGALVASTPAWIGEATLTGPAFTLTLTVHWQRPGWWRVASPAGDSAYDGRTVTVRLPGGPVHPIPPIAAANTNTWDVLWPAAALRRPGPITLDARGWPVGWQANGLRVHYTRVTPVPPLPRADFRVGAAAEGTAQAIPPGVAPPAALTPKHLPFTPRPVPGLRPQWTAAYDLPGQGPVAVFAYALDGGPLTIAEQPGTCPSTDPTWVRAPDGWIVHWCTGGLQFTADGPDDRPAVTRVVRALG